MARPVCETHPETPAVASCSRCFSPLCEVCLQVDGLQPLCAACLRRRRRGPRLRAIAIGLFLAAAGAGGYRLYKGYEPPYDYGEYAPKIHKLEADKLGLRLGAAPRTKLHTANGDRIGMFTTLDEVAVEGLAARRVPAVVVDDLGPGVDGLLGLSFLARFEMRQANGVVELAAKGAAAK